MKLFIAGHRGMVGSALCRAARGDYELLTAGRSELDLTDQASTFQWLAEQKPDSVIVAAAKVGGIQANVTYPGDFIYQNLAIAANLVEGARRSGVERLLFLGSSCIYPREAPQPMPESCLLTSELEPTNEPYAVAKIAGLELCRFYRAQFGLTYHSAMPTSLYGSGDNYHAENSHVIPALIRRFHEAKESRSDSVEIWGTGSPLREFLHVDDLAAACLLLLKTDEPPDLINVGTGKEISILDLAKLIAGVVGFEGSISTDPTKPDGTPRKLLDISKITNLDWRPCVTLEEGLANAYRDFMNNLAKGTVRDV